MATVVVTSCASVVAMVSLAAAVAARRVLAARMEAVARATHELRGPLTAARLGLQGAARGPECSPARLRSVDQELARATLALDDLAEPQARPRLIWNSERVDVADLLADSVEAMQTVAASWRVSLQMPEPEAPAAVVGDRLRLAQATGNLLSNAIEHGGGEVVARVRTDGTLVRIEITDSGPGLSEPVAELTRRARRGRGSRGRGLAIASAIARGHGGRLSAAPSESGARLVLELPQAADGVAAVR